MNGLTVTPTQILAGVGVLLVLFWVWRAGSRRAKAAAEAARSGARLVSLVGRVLFNAGLIVAVQWVVIAHPGSPWLLFAVLGLAGAVRVLRADPRHDRDHGRHPEAGWSAMNRAQRLAQDAAEAAEVRAYQTDPDVVALRIERVRRQVDWMCWSGIVLGLAFTMTNVQGFASAGTRPGSLPWLAAWVLDPTVSLVLLAILRAEQVTARYQVRTGVWVRRAKWFTLAATYVMNTWTSFAAGEAAAIVLHSVPPLVVFVAVEAITDLRDKLTDAVLVAAERQAVQPEPHESWSARAVCRLPCDRSGELDAGRRDHASVGAAGYRLLTRFVAPGGAGAAVGGRQWLTRCRSRPTPCWTANWSTTRCRNHVGESRRRTALCCGGGTRRVSRCG